MGETLPMQKSLMILAGLLSLTTCGSRGELASAGVKPFRPTAQREIVPTGSLLEVLFRGGEFTEGPAPAADGKILFSDIGNRILRFDPATTQVSVFREPSGKANGLMFDPEGRLVACEGANGGGRRLSITEADGTVRTLADRYQGKRFNSPNDLAMTSTGVIYFTDPRYVGDEPREMDFEGVFRVTPQGQVTLATDQLQKPNGIVISPDQKTIYIADNNSNPQGNHHLTAFSIQADGSLKEKRILWDFGPNRRGIDGMAIDQKGNLYATAGSGPNAGVYVFSPEGQPLALITVAGVPTNCVFAGPELKTLYITAGVPPADDSNVPPRFGLYRITLSQSGSLVFPPKR